MGQGYKEAEGDEGAEARGLRGLRGRCMKKIFKKKLTSVSFIYDHLTIDLK